MIVELKHKIGTVDAIQQQERLSMNPFTYKVALRITHPTMDPKQFSQTLSLRPQHSWMAGDQRATPAGTPLEGVYDHSYWSCTLSHEPNISLAECLETFTSSLERHHSFLLDIRSSGGRIEYFIGWFTNGNSGELFTSRLLEELAHNGIDLALDVYDGKSGRSHGPPP